MDAWRDGRTEGQRDGEMHGWRDGWRDVWREGGMGGCRGWPACGFTLLPNPPAHDFAHKCWEFSSCTEP